MAHFAPAIREHLDASARRLRKAVGAANSQPESEGRLFKTVVAQMLKPAESGLHFFGATPGDRTRWKHPVDASTEQGSRGLEQPSRAPQG